MLYGYLNSPFVSNPFSDAAIPPSSVASPVISGSGVIGQTLSTTNGTWSGTLPITYTYQWNRNGSVILGATFNTYTLVTADGSTSITCTVTATNAGGSLSKSSNAISVAAAGDADANAFIAAAAITDATQKSAINTLVTDLKGYGIWSKMKALYPFCGGTAAQHKFNLRNPIDSDSAFRLTFFGGITHNQNGITGNGTNGYVNTFLNEQSTLALNSKNISLYVRNNVTTSNTVQMGVYGGAAFSRFILNYNNSVNYSTLGAGQVGHTLNYPVKGFVCMSRTNSSNFKYYQNNDTPVTKTASSGTSNVNFYILAMNNVSASEYYSSDNLAFSSIGDGLTDTEVANFTTAIQAFQTTLGRQV